MKVINLGVQSPFPSRLVSGSKAGVRPYKIGEIFLEPHQEITGYFLIREGNGPGGTDGAGCTVEKELRENAQGTLELAP